MEIQGLSRKMDSFEKQFLKEVNGGSIELSDFALVLSNPKDHFEEIPEVDDRFPAYISGVKFGLLQVKYFGSDIGDLNKFCSSKKGSDIIFRAFRGYMNGDDVGYNRFIVSGGV